MTVVVNDKREEVSFCAMDGPLVQMVTLMISFGRHHGNAWFRLLATDLCLTCRWIVGPGKGISLTHMSWQQVWMLRAISRDRPFCDLDGPRSRQVVSEIAGAIQVAVDMSLKSHKHKSRG